MESLLLPLGTESEPEDDFWKGSKNGRKKGIEALGKSGRERAGAGGKRGGKLKIDVITNVEQRIFQ